MTRQQAERFIAKVYIGTDEECWPWQASTVGRKKSRGNHCYGRVGIAGRLADGELPPYHPNCLCSSVPAGVGEMLL